MIYNTYSNCGEEEHIIVFMAGSLNLRHKIKMELGSEDYLQVTETTTSVEFFFVKNKNTL